MVRRGWIKDVWQKTDYDARIIRLQKYTIIILCVVISILSVGWLTAPSRLLLYIPPNIENGSTIKADEIPASFIYSFAYEIWQEINYWPEENENAFAKNIQTYSPYLTPQFRTYLLESNASLKISGQLDRIRYLQGMNGAAFDIANVKKLSHDTWEVDLRMRITELKNNQTIKDVEILYPIKVTRFNVSMQNNPYGLALAGFVSEPKRLKSNI